MMDEFCPYRYCKQLWNAGKQDDYSEPWCKLMEGPCEYTVDTCPEWED